MTNEELERAVERLNVMTDWFMTPSDHRPAPSNMMRVSANLRLLLSERAELLAAVERMRGALEPFAACADTYADYTPDEAFTDSTDGLTVGECRRARAALTTGEATATEQGERG